MIKVEGRKYKLPYRNAIRPQTTCFIVVGNSSPSDWLATAVLFCRIVYRVFCGTACLTQKLLAPKPSKWALSENQTKLNQRNPNQLKVTHPTPRKTNINQPHLNLLKETNNESVGLIQFHLSISWVPLRGHHHTSRILLEGMACFVLVCVKQRFQKLLAPRCI